MHERVYAGIGVCVCMFTRVRAYVNEMHACVHVCIRVCAHVLVYVIVLAYKCVRARICLCMCLLAHRETEQKPVKRQRDAI